MSPIWPKDLWLKLGRDRSPFLLAERLGRLGMAATVATAKALCSVNSIRQSKKSHVDAVWCQAKGRVSREPGRGVAHTNELFGKK